MGASAWEVLLWVLLSALGPWPGEPEEGPTAAWVPWAAGAMVVGSLIGLAAVLIAR